MYVLRDVQEGYGGQMSEEQQQQQVRPATTF